jgi:transposase
MAVTPFAGQVGLDNQPLAMTATHISPDTTRGSEILSWAGMSHSVFAMLGRERSFRRVFIDSTIEAIYRRRNLVERFFCQIKHFRRIATRYDKLAERFASFVCLVCIVVSMR